MGLEKYEKFVRRTRAVLTYDPGWSHDNLTGAWRTARPVKIAEKCTRCGLCWLYCPEGCIEPGTITIDYRYCKGCGICAVECNLGAIDLVREEE